MSCTVRSPMLWSTEFSPAPRVGCLEAGRGKAVWTITPPALVKLAVTPLLAYSGTVPRDRILADATAGPAESRDGRHQR